MALSAFGSYPDRVALRQEARVLYGQALQKLNAALHDPVAAKSDETLLAVLLFSLYEVSSISTGWLGPPSNSPRRMNT